MKTAVELLERIHAAVAAGSVPADLLALDSQVTDCNAAIFDVANDFHGVIAGCHEILRRQGLLEGIWCLDPNETLGPGQKRGDRPRLRRLSASQRRRLRAREPASGGCRELSHRSAAVLRRPPTAGARIRAVPLRSSAARHHRLHDEEQAVARKSADAAALRAGGREPSRAGRGMASVRRARRGAEIRHAVALRHVPGAARPELSLAREHRRHHHRDFRRLYPGGRDRHRHRAAVLLVPLARDGGDAAAGQPQHDPEGRARPADHRLVQLRHRAQHHDGVRDLLLPDRADHGARPARGRARPARSRAHAQGLALADIHQDPAARRAALHLLRHEGRRDPGGRRRHRRRVPRLRPRARLPDAAGAGHARHRRHVHGGDPDHADRHGALRAGARRSSACWSCATRGCNRRSSMGEPFIHLAGVQKVYRTRGSGVSRHLRGDLRRRGRRAGLAGRPVGLRQDHAAQDSRRPASLTIPAR